MSETLRPLKPKILDVDVDSSTAGKERKHWKRTFRNYVIAFQTADNNSRPVASVNEFLVF